MAEPFEFKINRESAAGYFLVLAVSVTTYEEGFEAVYGSSFVAVYSPGCPTVVRQSFTAAAGRPAPRTGPR